MPITELTMEGKLCQLVGEYADDYYCLELLHFFSTHPFTRFSGLTLAHVLNTNGGKLGVEKALRYLVAEGIVRVCIQNDVPLYSLSENESPRSLVLELAKLDWGQWQMMLRQTYLLASQHQVRSN